MSYTRKDYLARQGALVRRALALVSPTFRIVLPAPIQWVLWRDSTNQTLTTADGDLLEVKTL